MKTKITVQKINEIKTWFFERINNINKPLANKLKERERRPKLIKLEMKRRLYSRWH
jgi:hypothetical protein